MKPICFPCRRFFRMRKSGFYFTEGFPVGNGRAKPGLAEPEKWKPYKLWAGDVWECEGCGATILSGFGQSPIAQHHEGDFEKALDSFGARQFQVNDC